MSLVCSESATFWVPQMCFCVRTGVKMLQNADRGTQKVAVISRVHRFTGHLDNNTCTHDHVHVISFKISCSVLGYGEWKLIWYSAVVSCFKICWDPFLLIMIVKSSYLSNCGFKPVLFHLTSLIIKEFPPTELLLTRWFLFSTYPRTSTVSKILKMAHLAPTTMTHSWQNHWYHWFLMGISLYKL